MQIWWNQRTKQQKFGLIGAAAIMLIALGSVL
jgi:hypothetical protein